MTTSTPATPSTPLTPSTPRVRCDTSDMLHIHRLFRRQFVDAPVLVRAVDEDDRARLAVVAAHVRELAAGLHHHHHVEDALLWDTLERRAPACALHVGLMRSQHAGVAMKLEELDARMAAWETSADGTSREAVATTLDEIRAALLMHLGQEEERILPAASTVMSQREWDQLRKQGMASIAKRTLLVQLGWILDCLPEPERADWVRTNLPVPLRLLWQLVGRRRFAAHRARVYAGVIA